MQNWVVPIAVALAAPLFVFLGIAYKLSGRIRTSEASQLWEEAGRMREEYLERARSCEIQLKQIRNELQVVTARCEILTKTNRELRDENKRLRR